MENVYCNINSEIKNVTALFKRWGTIWLWDQFKTTIINICLFSKNILYDDIRHFFFNTLCTCCLIKNQLNIINNLTSQNNNINIVSNFWITNIVYDNPHSRRKHKHKCNGIGENGVKKRKLFFVFAVEQQRRIRPIV